MTYRFDRFTILGLLFIILFLLSFLTGCLTPAQVRGLDEAAYRFQYLAAMDFPGREYPTMDFLGREYPTMQDIGTAPIVPPGLYGAYAPFFQTPVRTHVECFSLGDDFLTTCDSTTRY
jgi:hypothetical protein